MNFDQQGHLRRLDGDATLLLILASIRDSRFSSFSRCDDAGLRHQRVGQGGLAMIDVGDDGHVPVKGEIT